MLLKSHHTNESGVVSNAGAIANSIQVFVRVKPLNEGDKKMDKNKQWQIINEDRCIMHSYTREMYAFGKFIPLLIFCLDRVFNEAMTTQEIFESEGKKLILSALEGFNVTIFTYGQTASGKTFTMRGTDSLQPGMIPLSLREIFHELYTHHGVPFKPHNHHHHVYTAG